MTKLLWCKQLIEFIGGATDVPPRGVPIRAGQLWWGVLWGGLAYLITIFCGQSSKFIYIDF